MTTSGAATVEIFVRFWSFVERVAESSAVYFSGIFTISPLLERPSHSTPSGTSPVPSNFLNSFPSGSLMVISQSSTFSTYLISGLSVMVSSMPSPFGVRSSPSRVRYASGGGSLARASSRARSAARRASSSRRARSAARRASSSRRARSAASRASSSRRARSAASRASSSSRACSAARMVSSSPFRISEFWRYFSMALFHASFRFLYPAPVIGRWMRNPVRMPNLLTVSGPTAKLMTGAISSSRFSPPLIWGIMRNPALNDMAGMAPLPSLPLSVSPL